MVFGGGPTCTMSLLRWRRGGETPSVVSWVLLDMRVSLAADVYRRS
jgi:hypothetical protein